MLIGTVGHIDHGKTSLVKALTGVDTDRLPEEKARGITLDLGYAYAPIASDGGGDNALRRLGFIDMPGHEKLVRNMLAGATSIDFALLIIAADDGIMPQTREHLELLDLLNIRAGAVALSKCDSVDAARIAALTPEIEQLLAATTLAGSPLFPLSARTGVGVAALRNYLHDFAVKNIPCNTNRTGGFRLAIDRVFTLAGIGTVVTGTVFSGHVAVGDQLIISPVATGQAIGVRVKSLHVQDQPALQGEVGDRCALALAGNFDKQTIVRGMWVTAPDLATPLVRWQGEMRVPSSFSATLQHWSAVHVYIGTADIPARLALLDCEKAVAGQTALVEIVLQHPTLVVRGDRFILRDAAAQRTVGGGRVLDCAPPQRFKRTPQRLALLAHLRNDDAAVVLAKLLQYAPAGLDLHRFAAQWNIDPMAVEQLIQDLQLKTISDGAARLAYLPTIWQDVRLRLLDILRQEHERAPDLSGVERERLRRMTLAALPRRAFDALIDECLVSGALGQTRAWLHLPEHRACIAQADRALFAAIRTTFDMAPFNPPRVRDIAKETGMVEDAVRQLCKRLARAGELYPVAHDHYFTAAAIAELAKIITTACQAHGAIRAAELRDIIGGGRKVAIQILEFFDRMGYTRRVADEHHLRSQVEAAIFS